MRFDPILMESTLFLFIFLRLCICFSEKKIFETFDISVTHLFFYGKHILDIYDHLLGDTPLFLEILTNFWPKFLIFRIFEFFQADSKFTKSKSYQ